MNILNPLKNFKTRLTQIGKSEPLHFFSFAIIIALDIFVLMNIFQGLYLQTEQLDTPREVIPYACTNLLIDTDEDRGNRDDQQFRIIQSAVATERYFYEVQNKYASGIDIIEKNNKEKVDENCRAIYSHAKSLYSNKELKGYFNAIRNKEDSISQKNSENFRYRGNYDTMLLEDIAGQKEDLSIIDGKSGDVKARIAQNNAEISRLNSEISVLKKKIIQHTGVQYFINLIQQKQPLIEKRQSSLEFWYPLEKLFSQLFFLLPLFFFFLWLYRRMIQKENSVVSLIASHLLLVTLIPIVLKVFELFLDILPFHFFSDILEILEALNIIALFNYIVIIGAILLVLGLIYFLQKKVFSAQKIWEKRIQKKQCWSCGTLKASKNENFCSFCGEAQFEKCSYCSEQKIAKTEFCGNCGKK